MYVGKLRHDRNEPNRQQGGQNLRCKHHSTWVASDNVHSYRVGLRGILMVTDHKHIYERGLLMQLNAPIPQLT